MRNGKAAMVDGAIDGPQPGYAAVQYDIAAEVAKYNEQADRYGIEAVFVPQLGAVRVTLKSVKLVELRPTVVYIPVQVFLKVSGTLLTQIEFTSPVGV